VLSKNARAASTLHSVLKSRIAVAARGRVINHPLRRRLCDEYASHSLSKGRRQSGNPDVAPGIMELLPIYLEQDSVVAVGEIGFDDQTLAETRLFEQQMRTRL
jgi:hypothetical protein